MKLSYLSFAASILAGSAHAAKSHRVDKGTFQKQALEARLKMPKKGKGNGSSSGDAAPATVPVPVPVPVPSSSTVSAVYTLDMAVENHVQVYTRDPATGLLDLVQEVATGGAGTMIRQDPDLVALGSTDAIIVAGECVVAVNPGDNTVSAMQINPATGQLSYPSAIPSGGVFPLSVTHRNGLVYVLNAAGQGVIQAFALVQFGCILTPIGGPIETDQGGVTVQPQEQIEGMIFGSPSQIGFTPDDRLVVNIKRDGGIFQPTSPGPSINVYDVNPDGTLGNLVKTNIDQDGASTPFGFRFGPDDEMLIPDVFNQDFDLEQGGELIVYRGANYETRLQSIFTAMRGTCWLAYADGYVYTSNTAAGTMSSLSNASGKWEIAEPVAAEVPRPWDIVISADGEYLYVVSDGLLEGGTGESRLYSLKITGDGGLEVLQGDLPASPSSFLVGLALFEA